MLPSSWQKCSGHAGTSSFRNIGKQLPNKWCHNLERKILVYNIKLFDPWHAATVQEILRV